MDLVIISLYLGGILLFGLWYGRGIKDLGDYAVAGKAYSAPIIFATLSASFIGGGFSMGNAEKVFRFGIMNIVALFGFSLSQILIARFIAPRMGRYEDAISVGDIMEKSYGTKAKFFTGLFALIACAGILGAQIGAMGHIFNVFLEIPKFHGILIGIGIVLIYVTAGGMKSVVGTDIVQFIFLIIGIPLTLILAVHYSGGISALVHSVPAQHFSIPATGFTWTTFISLFLVFVVGETLVPPYVQRLLLARDVKAVSRGTLWSGIISIPFFMTSGLIGLSALVLNPGLDANLAMPFVVRTVLPVGVRAIMISAVIAIIMSSADSFLNAATVSFVNDIIKPMKSINLNPHQELRVARYFTIFLGIAGVIFAVKIESVLDILLFTYNFWAPVILVPLVAAILGKQATSRDFTVSAVCGIGGMILWNYILKQPRGFDGLVVGVVCSALGFMSSRVRGTRVQ
ncbi:sodium:solute symporter family protein [Fidelibacter multiformis]|jgi:SSS family solute:Na+ symporter|uniref:sodium:solute symporter family protein n=1 Tax=Fidelibacter multiformis TaxID=3377529 RepID=UPI0037DC8992